jgi:pyruvate dehydrogenase E2 component (dihydrolipoamide acetyltransferase)
MSRQLLENGNLTPTNPYAKVGLTYLMRYSSDMIFHNKCARCGVTSSVILPKLTYEMHEGRILEWLAVEGAPVSPGQVLFIVETDKAAIEVPAEESGVLLKILVPAGETIPVSSTVAYIGAPGETPVGAAAGPLTGGDTGTAGAAQVVAGAAATPAGGASGASDGSIPASPIARRMARELGIDLGEVLTFSGQKRVREADVQAYLDAHKAAEPPAGEPAPPAEPAKPASPVAPVPQTPEPAFELVRPTPLQKAMAARMSLAAAIPQMAAACDVDLTGLEQLKNRLQPGWELAQGHRLTYTHLMAALIARAATACRGANASWTEEGILYYRDVHLGVAMASERGLVVPVVRDAGSRSLREIAGEITRLQLAAEHNRLPLGDLENGTITMTNVGMLGIALSIPLLNPPQSAIVGVGAKREQVVLDSGEIKVKPVAAITVVADHRVMDGVAVAAFLNQIKQLVEHPLVALGLESA